MVILGAFSMCKFLSIIAFSFVASSVFAADIFKADRLFTEKNYHQAKQEYLKAAKIGNPHAYYQLANMYYKGLGSEQDPLNALIYFSLAAEYNFHNSEEVLNTILKGISAESRDTVINTLNEY